MYLGDGHLANTGRCYQLRVCLDAAYPGVIQECADAMAELIPTSRIGIYRRKDSNDVRICSAWKRLPELFPQHGPGPKHERAIELADWQRLYVDHHPQQFLRGLIHSDGSRCMNRFKTELPSGRVAEYEYPRYFFTNLSADIRGLFCEYCEMLGVCWTQSNPKNISVSHRDSVAILDSFIGPKT
jgi:hypothetical protein